MNDNLPEALGRQIRRLRAQRGWTLAELAHRAGTSAPTLHRYENGWYRFELETLRKIAAALEVRLDVRLVPAPRRTGTRRPTASGLVEALAPLFWEHALRVEELAQYPGWVLERVLTAGDRTQVQAARAYFGDAAVRAAVERRGVDRRTRAYWREILGEDERASQGT